VLKTARCSSNLQTPWLAKETRASFKRSRQRPQSAAAALQSSLAPGAKGGRRGRSARRRHAPALRTRPHSAMAAAAPPGVGDRALAAAQRAGVCQVP
jgi:hypothetical protein